jgi:hypothetical protein
MIELLSVAVGLALGAAGRRARHGGDRPRATGGPD